MTDNDVSMGGIAEKGRLYLIKIAKYLGSLIVSAWITIVFTFLISVCLSVVEVFQRKIDDVGSVKEFIGATWTEFGGIYLIVLVIGLALRFVLGVVIKYAKKCQAWFARTSDLEQHKIKHLENTSVIKAFSYLSYERRATRHSNSAFLSLLLILVTLVFSALFMVFAGKITSGDTTKSLIVDSISQRVASAEEILDQDSRRNLENLQELEIIELNVQDLDGQIKRFESLLTEADLQKDGASIDAKEKVFSLDGLSDSLNFMGELESLKKSRKDMESRFKMLSTDSDSMLEVMDGIILKTEQLIDESSPLLMELSRNDLQQEYKKQISARNKLKVEIAARENNTRVREATIDIDRYKEILFDYYEFELKDGITHSSASEASNAEISSQQLSTALDSRDTKLLITAWITRFGVLAMAIYLVRILISIYRYNIGLATFYRSLSDSTLYREEDLEFTGKLLGTIKPRDTLGFEKPEASGSINHGIRTIAEKIGKIRSQKPEQT